MGDSELRELMEEDSLSPKDKKVISETIADIAHQLRTPLTTINLLVSLIQKRGLEETKKQAYIQEINTHLARLDWLITALLRMSKIDAGTADFKHDKVELSDLIAQAAEPLMIQMELHSQVFDFSSGGRESFIGDINWSKEALGNIIKNCMEHTPDGGHISVIGRETGEYTEIEVTDTGRGIDPEDLPHIFDRYYRGKNSTGQQGAGIGLALTKKIINQQNGEITAENREKCGAKFVIRFNKHDE